MRDIRPLLFGVSLFFINLILIYKIFLSRNSQHPPSSYEKYDTIIIGSGLAGLTVAIQLFQIDSSSKILILEKEAYLGGNSAKATSGINLLETPIQKKNNIDDSFELFYDDTMKSSKNLSIPKLVEVLVNDSRDAFKFITDLNIDLSLISLLGGHSKARTHRPSSTPVGFTLTSKFEEFIKKNTSIKILLNATADEFLFNDKRVSGVLAFDTNQPHIKKQYYGKSIVLATGGYAHDFSEKSLLSEFVPEFYNFPTTNGPQAEGRGVKMGRKIGAGLIHMDRVQLHPTGFIDPKDYFGKKKILAPELIRGVGGILINHKGERFCNELGTRDYVTDAIMENCEKKKSQFESLLIINEIGRTEYGKNINFYISKGYMKPYPSFQALSDQFNIPFEGLSKTIETYNDCADEKRKDVFGKTVFPTKFKLDEKLYAGLITPSLHYTMGGLRINEKGQILREDESVIDGLYGAGEVTGGVHGGNRLAANSLLECVVFGRVVGKEIVKFNEKQKEN